MKTKIIYFPPPGKGGTGKTTGMSTLIDTLMATGLKISAIDCDAENADKPGAFHRVVPCERYNLHSTADLDDMIRGCAEGKAEHIVIDMPANGSTDFLPWATEMLNPELLDELGLRIVMVGVVTPEPASVASVLQWQRATYGMVENVVLLNRKVAERVPRSTEQTFAEWFAKISPDANILSVEMPGLYAPAAAKMQAAGGLPSRYKAQSSADLFDTRRIQAWAQKMHAAWQEVLPKIWGTEAK